MNGVEILGVTVHCVVVDEILSQLEAWVSTGEQRAVMYVNAHCLNVAYRDPDYREILNAAGLVYPDGISVVWSSRLLDGCRMVKITGADWIYNYCERAERSGQKAYVLAGQPGVASLACRNLVARYPGLKMVGTCDGYFQEKTEAQALAEIERLGPDIVFVGMGVPAQEKWVATRREAIAAPVVWTVGALFDYVAGIEPRAPRWMNALALEWLWRLMIDPRGKWRRYLIGNPLYVARVLKQRFHG